MHPKDADGMANSDLEDTDQIAVTDLDLSHLHCMPDLSVRMFRILAIVLHVDLFSSMLDCIPVVIILGVSSEFVSSSIPSWQILTGHAQPFRGARDLAFCLKVPLDSLLVWASSGGSGETAWMRRLAWTFAARIGTRFAWRGPFYLQFISMYYNHILITQMILCNNFHMRMTMHKICLLITRTTVKSSFSAIP